MTNPALGPIIAATDLSEHGDEAVRQAQAWSTRTGTPLVVLHALPDPTPMFAPMGRMTEMSEALKKARAARKSEVTAQVHALTGGAGTVEVHIGAPEDVVLHQADKLGASLIVVGGSEKGRIEQILLGSTAEQILRHSENDVLVARKSPPGGAILTCSDLSERSFAAVRAAAAEAARRGAALVALHALDIAHPVLAAFEPLVVVDDKTREDLHAACLRVLESEMESTGAGGTVEVIEGRPERVIIDAAEDRQVSLVVIATHGHTGLRRMALGSVASSVSRKASCSVLVVSATPG